MTVGLPASGKTTWARRWVEEDPKKRVRVNRDDIRRMVGPYWVPQREDYITYVENQMIILAVKDNLDVVIDATNLRGTGRFENLLRGLDVDIVVEDRFLDTPLKLCIQRDQQRDNKVGKQVIMRMYNKWLQSK